VFTKTNSSLINNFSNFKDNMFKDQCPSLSLCYNPATVVVHLDTLFGAAYVGSYTAISRPLMALYFGVYVMDCLAPSCSGISMLLGAFFCPAKSKL
jgi:hypothetical protein